MQNRNLIDAIATPVLLLDPAGCIVQSNRAFYSLSGFASDQIIGLPVWDVCTVPPEAGTFKQWVMRSLSGGSSEKYDSRLTRADGRQRVIVWSITVVEEHGERYGVCTGVDLTGRTSEDAFQNNELLKAAKADQDALRKCEERFRVALMDSPIFVFQQDRELRYTWVYNPPWDLTPQDIIGKTDGDLYSPEVAARLTEVKRRVMESRIGERHEVLLDARGAPRHFIANYIPTFDARGTAVGITCSATDVTELKQMEQKLRESVERATTILESISDGFIAIDGQWRVTYFNRAAERLTGKKQSEVLGEDLRRVFPEYLNLPLYSRLADSLTRGIIAHAEQYFSDADRWFEFHFYPAKPGASICFRDVSKRKRAEQKLKNRRDQLDQLVKERTAELEAANRELQREIAERRQAEQALQAEQQRLFGLLDGLPAYVKLQALDYSFRFVNRAFLDCFGDPDGRPCYEVLHGRTEPCPECHSLRVDATGVPEKWEWEAPNGRTYLVYTYPFVDTDGSRLVLEVGIDITDSKKAEQERLHLQEQAALAQRLTSLATMSAGIVHEINQPLNALKVTADAILYWYRKGRPIDVPKVIRDLERISAYAARIDEIIKHVRFLAADDEAHHPDELCDLNDAVDGALHLMGGQLSAHGITVITELDPALPQVRGSQSRFEEVIINLLRNAMDALDSVSRSDKKIRCSTRRSGDRVVLEISDNATGIPDEIKERIFDPFFSGKSAGRSLGLGLALAQSVVSRCGGEISVHDNEQGGATFVVTFPAVFSE